MDFRMIDEIVYKTMQLFGCFVEFSSEQAYCYQESHEAIQIRMGDHGTLLIIPNDSVCVLFLGDHHSNQEWMQHMERWSTIDSWEANFSTAHPDRYILAEQGELKTEPEPLPEPEEVRVGVM